MITDAKIVSAGAQCCLDWGTPETRTTAEYAVTPMDLVLFGHSPARWRLRPGRDPEDGPGRHELLRGTLLAASGAGAKYIPTPETYRTLRPVCPKCGSESSAATCRKCNTPRVNQAVERPWSPQAQNCKLWAEDVREKGLVPVPRALGEANRRMMDRIIGDRHTAKLLADSQKLVLVTGTYEGKDGKNCLPLKALIDIAPDECHELCATLTTVLVVPDASPGSWSNFAVKTGQHIQAALARQLFQAATGEDIKHYLWLLVEAKEPHILGRRRSTPELDKLAEQTCERLLERMLFCRNS